MDSHSLMMKKIRDAMSISPTTHKERMGLTIHKKMTTCQLPFYTKWEAMHIII